MDRTGEELLMIYSEIRELAIPLLPVSGEKENTIVVVLTS